MRLLHLSADYPDPLVSGKTRAIHNLIKLLPDIEHRVWSLNRVGWRAGIHALDFSDAAGTDHRAIAYGAPPHGLLLNTYLGRLTNWLVADIARMGYKPDAVHAHKLSVEGLVGLALARRLSCPLIVSSQGDSDLKILTARPDLRRAWRTVWTEAALVLPFAPWTAKRLAAVLGHRSGPVVVLPCPAGQLESMIPPRITGPVFRTGLHLGSAWRKNMPAVFRAIRAASASIPDIRLEIAGGGSAAAFAALSTAAEVTAPDRVRFVGTVANADMGQFLNGACAMVLPSLRESFGMVSTEALFAGTPCLISQGWGIDGYFPDGAVTLAVEATSVTAIADAMVRLAREEAAFKARLTSMTADGGLEQFTRESIARTYSTALGQAVRTMGT